MKPGPSLLPTTKKFLFAALLWSGFLIGVHALLSLTWRFAHLPVQLRAIFRAASEDSLITWTSIVSMFLLGALCLVLGRLEGSRGWQFSGLFFLFLSMDDEAQLHERLGWLSEVRGGPVYHWVIVILPLIAVAGIATFVHIWHSTGSAKSLRPRVLLAYGLWFFALALEASEKAVANADLRLRGFPAQEYTKFVEETCEMVAPVILLSCLMDLVGRLLLQRSVPLPSSDGNGLVERRERERRSSAI